MSRENKERKLMKPAASLFPSFYDLPTVGVPPPLDLNFIILFFDVFCLWGNNNFSKCAYL